MDQFQKQLITRQFYLQQMGAISLKADKAAKRIVVPKDAQPEEQVPTEDLGSEDSLSETRPLPADSDDVTSESDAEDPLYFFLSFFVATGCSEPPVPAILSTSPMHAATVPSPTPFPPEPSTPCVAASTTISLEEASIQAEKTCSMETPGPLFDPGANSTMVR